LKKSTPNPETEKALDLPPPGRAGNDKHPGRHLTAEVAIRLFPHIFGEIFAHALPGLIGHTESLQFLRRCSDALACAL